MDKTIKHYDEVADGYDETCYSKKSAPNYIRLNIILDRFEKWNIRSAVEVGSGTCYPLIQILKAGINAKGFDFSPGMVECGKKALIKAGYSSDLNILGDLEKKIPFKEKFDGMMMHGPLMHARDEKKLLTNAHKMLNKGGVLMCEVRNELMSAFSMNEYSKEFYLRLIGKLPPQIQKDVNEFYSKLTGCGHDCDNNPSIPGKSEYRTRFHNPFTISELFNSCGFRVNKLHFAHYHALPPIFESKYPKEFEELSYKLEKPDSWKGYLMASTFLVEAIKMNDYSNCTGQF